MHRELRAAIEVALQHTRFSTDRSGQEPDLDSSRRADEGREGAPRSPVSAGGRGPGARPPVAEPEGLRPGVPRTFGGPGVQGHGPDEPPVGGAGGRAGDGQPAPAARPIRAGTLRPRSRAGGGGGSSRVKLASSQHASQRSPGRGLPRRARREARQGGRQLVQGAETLCRSTRGIRDRETGKGRLRTVFLRSDLPLSGLASESIKSSHRPARPLSTPLVRSPTVGRWRASAPAPRRRIPGPVTP